jgi:hypothetical protein
MSQPCAAQRFPVILSANKRGNAMRTATYALAGLVGISLANLALTGTAYADPLKIRGSWVAPVSNWASIWLEKKDLAVHLGKSYVFESVRYAADDHGNGDR